mmetsp:Transcript_15676/g.49956  ORF Transcript_15676/g.49956 Transcript_15676/m.49956 type:complete len:214 (-) Transcript_15676:819-1460(-)
MRGPHLRGATLANVTKMDCTPSRDRSHDGWHCESRMRRADGRMDGLHSRTLRRRTHWACWSSSTTGKNTQRWSWEAGSKPASPIHRTIAERSRPGPGQRSPAASNHPRTNRSPTLPTTPAAPLRCLSLLLLRRRPQIAWPRANPRARGRPSSRRTGRPSAAPLRPSPRVRTAHRRPDARRPRAPPCTLAWRRRACGATRAFAASGRAHAGPCA